MLRAPSKVATRITSLTFFGFLFYTLNYFASWPLLRYWNKSSGVFGDARDVLHSAACFKQYGTLVYSRKASEAGCGYWYGSSLLKLLNFLQIKESHYIFIGFLFIFILVLSIAIIILVFESNFVTAFVIYAIFLVSPPMMLLAQRANFDTLILFFLTISIILLSKKNILVSYGMIVVVVLFKFYPLPLLVFLLSLFQDLKKKFIAIIGLILTMSLIIPDLIKTPVLKGNSIYVADSFGIGSLTGSINLTESMQVNPTFAKFLDFLVFVFIIIILQITLKKQLSRALICTPSVEQIYAFLLFSLVFIVCYFGSSVDYRLIFLVPIFFLFWSCSSNNENYRAVISILFFSSFFLSFPSGRMNIFGDLATTVIAAMLVVILVNNAKFVFKNYKIF